MMRNSIVSFYDHMMATNVVTWNHSLKHYATKSKELKDSRYIHREKTGIML